MDAEKLSCRAYRFDQFTLDLHQGALLTAKGTELPLRPKSFALLQLFVENAGRLLDRDTIMRAIWPDVFVTDDSITQCIRDIRRALGDEAQRLVRTVPRRGYLFAAEVSRIEPIKVSPREEPQASAGQPAAPAPPSGNGAVQDRRDDSEEPVAHPDPEAAPGLTGLGRQEPSLGSERRHLTVLACDLVNSTGLLERMDPEDAGTIMHAFLQRCAAVITGCGGHVATYTGDGVVAYFGYPHAREDAAERSVRAGLALVEAVATLETGPDLALQLRVGIATGLVVNDRIGEGAQGHLAVGQPLNLAARLQALARPATVVMADSTRRLVGGLFALEDLGLHALKGFAAPVRVWRVIGEGMVESRFEALHGASLTPLVGRSQELTLLLDRWEQAKEGEGQVVLLAGEPGIGKSRLVQALRDRLADEPHAYQGYYCSPYYRDSPLQPVIAHLERAANFAPDDDPGQKLVKLESLLAQGKIDVTRAAPLISSLLSVPSDGRYPPLDLTPQLQRKRTLAALVDQLAGLATHWPVLLVWEDAHWADPTSLELLELAIDRLQDLPVLAFVTFRPEFAPTWPGHTHITRLTLNRLNRRCCSQLVAGLTGGKSLSAVVLGQILAKAEGVPLFVEELTKMMLEGGLLREKDNRYELKSLLPPAEIPATLQDSLMARLDRLAPVKEIAQVGAVIGREFSHELLATVVSWEEKDLNEALRRLVAAELIFRRGVGSEATYVFKHALVQDAAYATLLRTKRRDLHGRIAQVLVDLFQDVAESHPELLAHHYMEAGHIERAIYFWRLAGERAMVYSANTEAIRHFARALQLLTTLPSNPERDRLELDLQLSYSVPSFASKWGNVQVQKAYERARALSEQLGDNHSAFIALRGLWHCHFTQGLLNSARDLGSQMLWLAERSGNRVHRVVARRALGATLVFLGDFTKASEHLEYGKNCWESFPLEQQTIIAGEEPGLACRLYLAYAQWFLGFPEQALEAIDQAMCHAQDLSHPYSMTWALCMAAQVHQYRREPQSVQERAEAAMAIATNHGFTPWVAHATIMRGWAIAHQQGEVGVAEMARGLAAWQAPGVQNSATYFPALLAEAYITTGRLDEALDVLNVALADLKTKSERYYLAELYRLKGKTLSKKFGHEKEVSQCYGQALNIAVAQCARSLSLRSAKELAYLWREQGDNSAARDLLAPIYSSFDEGHDLPDLKEAKALLEDLGPVARSDA
jgi:class 3 adenylate cyclase/predicted ATPase